MTQMTIAFAASHLSSNHSMTVIMMFCYFCFLQLIVKCGPSTSTVVFEVRSEEGFSTYNTVVGSRVVCFIVLVWVSEDILLYGGSVPLSCVTWYWMGVSLFLSSSCEYFCMLLWYLEKDRLSFLRIFIMKISKLNVFKQFYQKNIKKVLLMINLHNNHIG